jgi:hypothetical protein
MSEPCDILLQVAELTYEDLGSARAAVNAMNGCVRPLSTRFQSKLSKTKFCFDLF